VMPIGIRPRRPPAAETYSEEGTVAAIPPLPPLPFPTYRSSLCDGHLHGHLSSLVSWRREEQQLLTAARA